MRYLLDGRSLQDGSAVRGIGTYVRGLLAGFAEIGVASEIELLLRSSGDVPPEVADLRLHKSSARVPVVKRRIQPLVDPLLLAASVSRAHVDLFHGVDFAQPIASRLPVVVTVHDLIPFVMPREYPWARRERLLALRLLRHADALIADSQSTANDLIRLGRANPERIRVIPLGVSAEFKPAAAGECDRVRTKYGLGDRRFLLGVGTFDPRKRIDLLAEVVANVRRHHDVDVVIAGSQGNFAQRVTDALAGKDLTGHCHQLGHVPREDLIALYGGAECVLFTSAYEGFGLPPLEAMACGTPVALFNNSSLPEIAGDVALIVAEADAAAMADQVAAVLADPALRTRVSEAGLTWARSFTWAKTARATHDVYQRVLR